MKNYSAAVKKSSYHREGAKKLCTRFGFLRKNKDNASSESVSSLYSIMVASCTQQSIKINAAVELLRPVFSF